MSETIEGFWYLTDEGYQWIGDDWDFEENEDGTRRMPLDVLSKLMEVRTSFNKTELN